MIAIIPARSGSKSVKDKNIRLLDGKPLIAYSIEHALKAKSISRVIVSTDSDKYAQIAREYGAEIPFLRPSEYAQDSSLDIDVFAHALRWLKDNEDYCPEIVAHLRPTYPIRNPQDIDEMVSMLAGDPEADAVRCITPAKEIAYKMWKMSLDDVLFPILSDIPEAYNMPRQSLPQIYYQNACIDVIRSSTIIEKKSMTGDRILGYNMKHFFDIDTETDFMKAEQFIKYSKGGNKYVFDIDGVITIPQDNINYNLSQPNNETIEIINYLYEHGNEIVIFTARGSKTGIDWKNHTIEQLKRWGVKYHDLKFGKPDADFYIDDKLIDLQSLQVFHNLIKG